MSRSKPFDQSEFLESYLHVDSEDLQRDVSGHSGCSMEQYSDAVEIGPDRKACWRKLDFESATNAVLEATEESTEAANIAGPSEIKFEPYELEQFARSPVFDEWLREEFSMQFPSEGIRCDRHNEQSNSNRNRERDESIERSILRQLDGVDTTESNSALRRKPRAVVAEQSNGNNISINTRGERATTEITEFKRMWLQEIKTHHKYARLMHDIVDTRDDRRRDFIIQKIEEIDNVGEHFLMAVEHKLDNFSHFHIIHNCNFINSHCRCSFLTHIPFLKRTYKSSKHIYKLNDEYYDNLFEYFIKQCYEIRKIIFGRQAWQIPDKATSKSKSVFYIYFIYFNYLMHVLTYS